MNVISSVPKEQRNKVTKKQSCRETKDQGGKEYRIPFEAYGLLPTAYSVQPILEFGIFAVGER